MVNDNDADGRVSGNDDDNDIDGNKDDRSNEINKLLIIMKLLIEKKKTLGDSCNADEKQKTIKKIISISNKLQLHKKCINPYFKQTFHN